MTTILRVSWLVKNLLFVIPVHPNKIYVYSSNRPHILSPPAPDFFMMCSPNTLCVSYYTCKPIENPLYCSIKRCVLKRAKLITECRLLWKKLVTVFKTQALLNERRSFSRMLHLFYTKWVVSKLLTPRNIACAVVIKKKKRVLKNQA